MKRSAKTVGPIYVYAFGIVMDAHGMFDLVRKRLLRMSLSREIEVLNGYHGVKSLVEHFFVVSSCPPSHRCAHTHTHTHTHIG